MRGCIRIPLCRDCAGTCAMDNLLLPRPGAR